MSQPTIWPKKTFFYPVGNTTPCCFTQDLCPEQDANILLLACGDPRSILYTVFADLTTCDRKLDFTCVDWQPAVLARNVLLFSLVLDNVDSSIVFSLFYNFLLDTNALKTLAIQCEHVIQLSADLQTWKSSKYGTLIRFSSHRSMECIRNYWVLYKETAALPKKAKERLKSTFLSGMKSELSKYGEHDSFAVATGPLISSLLQDKAQQNLAPHKELWTTGVVSSAVFKNCNLVNPTFVHSLDGDAFDVHYGTSPLKSFYLAPAIASTTDHGAPASNLTDYTKSCIAQFTEWCTAFKIRLEHRPESVIVRVYVGEGLAFCRALRHCQETSEVDSGAYTYPWGGTQIVLDANDYGPNPSAPTLFDVIDTSNLTDHCGLLNLLIVAVPLLRRAPSSIIHTHTLLPAELGKTESVLLKKAFSDIPSLSLMLGVAPTSFISHFAATSNLHALGAEGQFPQAISWRFISTVISGPFKSAVTLRPSYMALDPTTLSRFLLSVYHKMFAEEDQLLNLANIGLANVRKQDMILYQRSSFVSFIQFIKAKINTDWDRAIPSLIKLIAEDRTFLMGAHSVQELLCQLHLQGLHTAGFLPSATLEEAQMHGSRLSGWRSIPPVVCIVLKVPRSSLKTIESLPLEKIGTPPLQCETSNFSFHNIHASIQPIFGDIKASLVDGEEEVEIIDDLEGLKGSADLIVTFHIPSHLVITYPSMDVGLHIRNSPSTTLLMPKFGMRLTIFSTSLKDTKRLFIVRHRPSNRHERNRLQIGPRLEPDTSTLSSHVTLGFDALSKRVTTLTMRDDLVDPREAASLRDGAEVQTHQASDCGILVTFKGYRRIFSFPYPVQGNACKTRIARKSSYIEVICPIRHNFSDSKDLSLNLFPIYRRQQSLNLLNIHYLNLKVLPTLRLQVPKTKLQWISTHFGMTFSDNERALNQQGDPIAKGTLVNLKETVLALFLSYAGLNKDAQNQQQQVIGLTSPTSGIQTYTLIFINDMKLDLAGHTIVLDACVVALTDPLVARIGPLLSRLMDDGFISLVTHDDEVRAWRQLLAAAAERCRTWQHTPNCEFMTRGIPRILDGVEENPLCSCGKGKNLGAFGRNSKWTMVHKEATRIALSPLIAHPFLDDSVFSPSSASQPSTGGKSEQCAKCAKTGVTLQACGACRMTKYCSRDCQKSHWKAHKPQCKSATL
ncbi:hypothetical protein CPB83DRAFT_894716 [Crepidotus variabilis]|uniref:MYND-type domain-containing protein n=1 Tax=Crepidotus variabilis TaxID=179855 RepID=A0A9P6EFL7_9AGAR|nr:hypothetical protein CPB83DRAFT_894716 [Crepidotus variabilis]